MFVPQAKKTPAHAGFFVDRCKEVYRVFSATDKHASTPWSGWSGTEFFLDRADNGLAGGGADGEQHAFFLIEADQWRGLLIISIEAMADGRFGLVLALHHRAAALVADAFLLRRHALDVVDRLALGIGAGAAGAEAVEDHVARHVDIYPPFQVYSQFYPQL